MKISEIDARVAVMSDLLDAPVPESEPFHPWARWSEGSDIFVGKRGRQAECINCHFVADGRGIYLSRITNEMIKHVEKHRRAGHAVPDDLETVIVRTWSKP